MLHVPKDSADYVKTVLQTRSLEERYRLSLLVVFAAIVFGFVAPFLAARYDGVVTLSNVVSKLPPAVVPSNVHVIAFFPGESTPVWPFTYAALGLLLVWFAPSRPWHSLCAHWPYWGGTLLMLSACSIGANYIRQLATSYADGRRVFSHANLDIAPWSAGTQLFQFEVLSFLVTGVWMTWLFEGKHTTTPTPCTATAATDSEATTTTPGSAVEPFHPAFAPEATLRLSDTFSTWQKISVLLVCAFLPGTFVYWRLVYKFQDSRYLIPAVVHHCLWIITWFVTSRPLAEEWRRWHHLRFAAIATLASRRRKKRNNDTGEPSYKDAIDALERLKPIAPFSAVAAALATIVSLLAPLYHAVK